MDLSTSAEPTPVMDQVLRDEANFIQNVSQFYNQEALSDITIQVGDSKFHGHKFILAKSSDVFRAMLYEKTWNEGEKNQIELSETAECQAVFDKFLRYLYTAEVNISTSTAVGILCLADKYSVMSLKELCARYMIENSKSPKVTNALTWYPWAKALHLESLIDQCTRTISWNYHEIITVPQWLNMELDFLVDMLQSSELVVPNEFALWEAVTKWLLQENHLENLASNAQKLLPLLRLPQMMVAQLYLLEQSELASRSECKELLQGLISSAYRFRALCPSQGQLGITFSEPCYLPREYTDLSVDNVRMQNTLRFGIQVDVKMYKGPVPSTVRDGDWKITYRKQGDIWSLLLYCHETAMINNEARVQASLVIYNDQEKVVHVHHEPTCVCQRGSTYTIQTSLQNRDQSHNMAVLLKPMPS